MSKKRFVSNEFIGSKLTSGLFTYLHCNFDELIKKISEILGLLRKFVKL